MRLIGLLWSSSCGSSKRHRKHRWRLRCSQQLNLVLEARDRLNLEWEVRVRLSKTNSRIFTSRPKLPQRLKQNPSHLSQLQLRARSREDLELDSTSILTREDRRQTLTLKSSRRKKRKRRSERSSRDLKKRSSRIQKGMGMILTITKTSYSNIGRMIPTC